MRERRFVGLAKVESREVPAPVIDDAARARPCGLAIVTMMNLTSRGDGK
jgi:hypothetical protein